MQASSRLLAFAFWSWVVLSLITPIHCIDVWWQLATGRYIWAHHAIPAVDVFSLTCRGKPWINMEWLYQVILYGIYRVAGLSGITLFKIGMIACALYFLYRRLTNSKIEPFFIYAVMTLAFAACRPGWSERADLLSIALVSALLYTTEAVRLGEKSPKALVFWIPLFCFWANSHPGFIIGLGIAGVYTLQYVWEKRVSTGRAFLWFLSCLGASWLTPYKTVGWRGIYECLSYNYDYLLEYKPPPFLAMAVFWSAVSLFLLLLLRSISKKERPEWFVFLLSAIFLWEAVRHARYVPFFMFVAFPFAISPSKLTFPLKWLSLPLLVLSLMQIPHVSLGIPPNEVPVGLCNFIATHRIQRRFLNDYDFGSYWIWRFAGQPPVFIDGRYTTVNGYRSLASEITNAQHGTPQAWQSFLNHYGITAVATHQIEPAMRKAIFSAYFPSAQWSLVYQDDLGVLFLKREKGFV